MRKVPSTTPAVDPMRYLKERKGNWHYVRRVPSDFAALDTRGTIQLSLKTRSLDVAKLRRDAQERADDLCWQGIVNGDAGDALASYEVAKARARSLGFEYKAADALSVGPLEDIIRRLGVAATSSVHHQDAVLGLEDQPRLSVTKASGVYLDEVSIGEEKGMSPQQKRKRREQNTFAATKFVEVISDKPILEITRDDALKYHRWWMDRVIGKDEKPISGNTANRAFGNMRKLFREYAAHIGLDIKNPFDKLSFPDRKGQQKEVPPFETAFIRDKLLAPGVHASLNREALGIFLAMVETGCRPSEICNLQAKDIHLSAKVPYISIQYQEDRVIKTASSARDVPLMGVSLAVMKKFPRGFPRYHDREYTLSATLMKHLRKQHLLPTKDHKVYSLRHSFEKRMLEGGLDYEFRRRIVGHSVEREKYGDGGSMEWRLEQISKIVLPFDPAVVP